ncbi:DUF2500 domain-containing protein [Hafnia paralvei]|uniref:DUF2500 domain-containing protein n=1 Tax=Hafnia paralvei TaxID=546367 RepID=UPI0024B93858|nr:DUF2500 domain-containing protein [Hafnia paralvei]
MSKPPLIFVVIVAVIVVFAAQRFMQQRRQNAINDAAPINTQKVEVSAKREFPAPNRRSRQREVIAGEDMRYEVYFKPLIGGSELKFIVPETTYHQIDKGAVGKLSTQGTRFIGFEADVK